MRVSLIALMSLWIGVANASNDLTAAIENVRTACGDISAELADMKKKAGITTAVTGAGTVAGGVATGTGIAKAHLDKQIEAFERILQEKAVQQKNSKIIFTIINPDDIEKELNSEDFKTIDLDKFLEKATQQSKQLGNIRTGTLAAATVTNIAGAVMSGTNQIKGDLKKQIDECLASVKTLSNVRMQARMDGSATDTDLARAEEIVRACDAWITVDINQINKRSTGATVSAGLGAGLGLAGTITSASANSDRVRDGDSDKEKNLNTAANVLAGGTTAASATATIFNATQISAIKRAATVADECEEALR